MNKLEQIQVQGYKFLLNDYKVNVVVSRAIEAKETDCLVSLVLLPDRSRVVITAKQERSRFFGTMVAEDYGMAEIIIPAIDVESAKAWLLTEINHLIGAATDNRLSQVLINGDDLTLWYIPLHSDDGDLINVFAAWFPAGKDDSTSPICLNEDEAEQLLLREILLDRGYAMEARAALNTFFGCNIEKLIDPA